MKAAERLLPVILAGAALLLPCRVSAAHDQWTYLTATAAGGRFFYDISSVTPLSKDVIQVRTREIAGDGATTSSLQEVDCANKIVREREVVAETANRPPQVSHEVGDWRAMELDPAMSRLFTVLCR